MGRECGGGQEQHANVSRAQGEARAVFSLHCVSVSLRWPRHVPRRGSSRPSVHAHANGGPGEAPDLEPETSEEPGLSGREEGGPLLVDFRRWVQWKCPPCSWFTTKCGSGKPDGCGSATEEAGFFVIRTPRYENAFAIQLKRPRRGSVRAGAGTDALAAVSEPSQGDTVEHDGQKTIFASSRTCRVWPHEMHCTCLRLSVEACFGVSTIRIRMFACAASDSSSRVETSAVAPPPSATCAGGGERVVSSTGATVTSRRCMKSS